MADAFKHASGMAQSHGDGKEGGPPGPNMADFMKQFKKPPPEVPPFDARYPPLAGGAPTRKLHREEKIHISGGVTRIEYTVTEDRAARCVVVAPFDTGADASLRAICLDSERLFPQVDPCVCN